MQTNSYIGVHLVGRNGAPHQRVQAVVDEVLSRNSSGLPKILEAGCGSMNRITLPVPHVLWGLDLSQKQLDKHTALHRKIQGNLETHDWGQEKFDLVVCWDVIEHLPNPHLAMEKMLAVLNPGGALVLAFPNLWSLKGLVTKFTPFWFHAAFYRYVIGDRRSISDLDQFPTYFRGYIAPNNLIKVAKGQCVDLIYSEIYEGPVQAGLRSKNKLFDIGFKFLEMTKYIFFGRIDPGLSDCLLVFSRKDE